MAIDAKGDAAGIKGCREETVNVASIGQCRSAPGVPAAIHELSMIGPQGVDMTIRLGGKIDIQVANLSR